MVHQAHMTSTQTLLPAVLFLGDGANDVSMIQVADVGVGISGQEGMQVKTHQVTRRLSHAFPRALSS